MIIMSKRRSTTLKVTYLQIKVVQYHRIFYNTEFYTKFVGNTKDVVKKSSSPRKNMRRKLSSCKKGEKEDQLHKRAKKGY